MTNRLQRGLDKRRADHMIERTSIAIVVILFVALTLSARAADETPTQAAAEWKVGVASAKITPEQRLHMAGYTGRKKPAEGTEQDLIAKRSRSRTGKATAWCS